MVALRIVGQYVWRCAYAIVALAFVGIGLWAIACYGLTELYADQWRQYLTYLALPFPADALAADNGHRTVFPSLIRLLELELFDGNQRLQLVVGASCAFASWLLVVRTALRDETVAAAARWPVVALTAFALFWIGNARMLLHGNEAVHVHLIILSLLGALLVTSDDRRRRWRLVAACLFGVVATFSFGSGMAVFPALAVALALQRRARDLALVLAVAAITLAVYMTVPGGDGVRHAIGLRPLANLGTMATWLASMWFYLLQPFIDPDSGGSLLLLKETASSTARAYRSVFGDPELNPIPLTVVGGFGLAWLSGLTWHAWRRRADGATLRLGIGMAWFAVGVAGIVSLGRLDYFAAHPAQIFANRYVPWSCLFWCGVLTAALAFPAAAGTGARLRMASLSVLIAVALCLGLLTTRGHLLWSQIVQQGVRLDSAAFVAGVIDDDRSLGESLHEEVATALNRIRAARVAEFAWPESRLIGQRVPFARVGAGVTPLRFEAIPARNRLGGDAMRIELQFQRTDDVEMPPRLLVIVDGRAAGVLVQQTTMPGWSYAGYVAQPVTTDELRVLRLREGGDECWVGCGDGSYSQSPPEPGRRH